MGGARPDQQAAKTLLSLTVWFLGFSFCKNVFLQTRLGTKILMRLLFIWTVPFVFPVTAMLMAGCGDSGPPKPVAPTAVQPRETIRKTTQNVLKLESALAEGGQLVQGSGQVGPSGNTEGYLGSVAQAYRSSVGAIAVQQVQQALQIYDIQNNGPVKTYDEFMSGVIKKDQPDGIQLPMLPYYQEFAYDEANRQLVVVEFPARKAEHEKSAK